MTSAFRNIASANRIIITANWNKKIGHHITAVSQNVGFSAFWMLVLYLQSLVINRSLRLIKSHTSGSRGTLCLTLNPPHIQAHLVFQPHKSKVKNQKSLNFPNTRKKNFKTLDKRNIIIIFVKIVKI